mmetsp:Transcript_3519/g.5178  ORF Transcript_3519/g.5178 Transcript_3519/m.5178 type:complete len:201 (+) Transcript_3519:57-659(+)
MTSYILGSIVRMYIAHNQKELLYYSYHLGSTNILQMFLYSVILPYPSISPLYDSCASLANSPQSLWDGGWIIQIHVGEFLLDGIGSFLCLVVWNGKIKMMSHVCASNLMVQKVNRSPRIQFIVWSINCMKSTSHVRKFIFGKVWNVHVGVLQPRIQHQPRIHNEIRSSVQCHHLLGSTENTPCQESGYNSSNTNITLVYL